MSPSKAPVPPPDLKIPSSPHTVKVSILNSAFVGDLPVAYFMTPAIPGYDKVQAPCFSFLIQHDNPDAPSKYDTLLFDLGVRKDWRENGPKSTTKMIEDGGFVVEVERDVAEILKGNGVALEKVGGIVWSHYHFDHTGDPGTFPPSTDLIVGPGFKSKHTPAYPTDPDGSVDERAWEGRTLREISFDDTKLKLGPFPALDFFGDGSFFLLDSPGHTVGHMCGLARTKADPPEFIIMGGDIAHHGGEFRPTQWLPLPSEIKPDPRNLKKASSVCPGALFEALHPKHSSTEPFMAPNGPVHDDKEQAMASVEKFEEFDAADNVFAIIAHDGSLVDVMDFYPKEANGWREKGWKEEGLWRFLGDFDTSGVEKKK